MNLQTRGQTAQALFNKISDQKFLLLLLLPGVLWFFVLCYIPLGGIAIAFQDYKPELGFLNSQWVGLKHFVNFFKSPWFGKIIQNTVAISLVKLFFGFPLPIVFALLLNEVRNRRFKRFVQTVSYMPHFISWVVTLAIFGKILSVDGGLLNQAILALGGKPVNFYSDPAWMWPLAYFTEVWKEAGWDAIIYLAALSSIDPQLNESAMVDGASKVKRMVHISLPGIASTIAVILILRLGYLFSANFDQMYILGNQATYDTAEVIDTYVYRHNLAHSQYSLGTAIGLMRSVINITLVLAANQASKAVMGYGLF